METDNIQILLTGDFCPINRIEKLSLSRNYEPVFNDLIDVFKDNDLNITDMECPLTLSDSGRPKTGPHQKAHPANISLLDYAGINLAAMANNHIMDYDADGVTDTLELCNKNAIDVVGIGKSREIAAKPFTTTIKNKKIAVFNYADNEFLVTTDGSYCCNPIDPVSCFYDLNKARRENDIIIVIIHAGNEFYELPSPRTKRLYRSIIDMGADIIVAHHTHAFSGYEVYNSKPIFYGLGNFIYDWPGKINSTWNEGYLVKLLISDKIDFEIIPLKQNNEQPGVFHLNTEENDTFIKKINKLNLIIANDHQLEDEFEKYCRSVFPMYDAFIEPNFGKYITALRKRGLFPKLMSGKKRLLLLNLLRCESHRDVLIRMLK